MIQLEDLLAAGGRLHGEPVAREFSDFSYDSRLIRPGELFIALRTSRADGHDYIAAALASGAAGVVCVWPPVGSHRTTVIQTDDPLTLIQQWAARRLRVVGPQVIAVTGSVGKTSTKRAISALLATRAPTFQSRRSFNSLLGLPIALARLHDDDRFAVLEFGTDRFGEITRLADLFTPRIGVVTAIGAAHLKAFGSLDGVAREKGALVEALPDDGWAILNGDDPHVAKLRERTNAHVLTFGQGAGCDVRASAVAYALDHTRLRLHWRDQSVDASIPLLGEPSVYSALAAVSVALVCDMPLKAAADGLARIAPVEGRLRLLPALNNAILIDDTFNAALPSMLSALRTLAALPARRRIVILGDLSNDHGSTLADYAHAAESIGALAGATADRLIYKGDQGMAVVQAAHRVRPDLPAHIVHTAATVRQALPDDLGPGDVLLVKGSAEARMERIAAELLAPGVLPGDVLVRQEPAWHSVRIGAPDRPTWLRIDLDALAHNISRLRDIAGVPLMAVLKADAYGHGATRAARTALDNGAVSLAVATIGEARTLRDADINAPILVLGYTPPWQARDAVARNITCTIFDDDIAHALSNAAVELQREAVVHIKVDTGMARLGLDPKDVGAFLRKLHRPDFPRLRVEGIYSHFATADSADERFALHQLERFAAVLDTLASTGLRPPIAHMANSAALLRFPAARFDMARPGIACYGLSPAPETPTPEDFRPALSFHTEVAQVKTHPPHTPISYGGIFITRRLARIATIPVGYADGFRRTPPWREVLVRGRRAPVVGRVCMDYAMIDVTEIEGVKRGDPVVLIGAQGNDRITADEVARWLGTINYDVVTTILARVPRETEQ